MKRAVETCLGHEWRRLPVRSNEQTTNLGVTWLMTILLFLPLFFVAQEIKGDGDDEFCQWEMFRADCATDDEVLMVTKAVYGRMRLGRCIQRDFGYVNCGMDALDAVSLLCSARRTCSFAVTILHGNHPCPIDLTGYLVVKHVCLKVTQCKPSYCLRSETVKVPYGGGYLSAAKPPGGSGSGGGSSDGHCGTLNCPWTLEANLGQRINLTLLDFSADLMKVPDGAPAGAPAGSICYRYASIRDGNLTKDLTGCGKEGQRTRGGRRSVYLSESHVVQITIYTSHTNTVHFLIRYQTSGCPAVQAPENSKLKQTNDGVIVECLYSDRNWRLRCNGSTWIGNGGTCDSPLVTNQNDLKVSVDGIRERHKTSSLGVIIVVGLGIVIGIIIGFGMLVFLTCCIRRRNLHSNGATQVGSPIYWKTRSELVYHGSDLYHCDHASMISPPPQTIHDYGWPSSGDKTPPLAATSPSPHPIHLRHNHLIDYPAKCTDDVTLVDHGKCQQQQQQQQQADHCTALKLKRSHVYELPRAQDKVRCPTSTTTCPGDPPQSHGGGGGGGDHSKRQGTCT